MRKSSLALVLALAACAAPTLAQAQDVFDFDTAPLHASFPLDLTVNGLTAHLTGNYSIQAANALGFTPIGFAGQCVYPNSIYQSDLGVGFSESLTDFSVLYAVDELACDSSATMRVTAFQNGVQVGVADTVAPIPGTYTTQTLAIHVATGFNSVIVHWVKAGLACSDYGPIFLADNMVVTRSAAVGVVGDPALARPRLDAPAPSPFRDATAIAFSLPRAARVRLVVYDVGGRALRTLADAVTKAGDTRVPWDGRDDAGRRVPPGVYQVRLAADGAWLVRKVVRVE